MRPDINCDTGEGIGNDAALMPFISSANIACGFHAGDEATMRRTVQSALQHGVALGAHPSFLDREHFGRQEMACTTGEVYELVVDQVRILERIARDYGGKLHHVKPHGALYNMAARDGELAAAIVRAVKECGAGLVLYGLSGSHLIAEAKAAGLRTASEVFADRRYGDDGRLMPRSQQGALIEDVEQAVRQVVQMVREGTVTSVTGKKIPIVAETICIHGDGKHAVALARRLAEVFAGEDGER